MAVVAPLYYEDLEVGRTYMTGRREVTPALVDRFAAVEGGEGALHNDPESARASIWGKITVHGMLTVSVAVGLMTATGLFEGTVLAMLETTCRFPAPLSVGDEVQVRWWISSKRPTADSSRAVVVRDFVMLDRSNTAVCEGSITSLWATRGAQCDD
jgi:acyl dehydratase